MNEQIKAIADFYGLDPQLLKLVEEMSELTKEITKYLLSDSDTDKDYYYNATIPSEIADVGLVIKQVMYLMDNESYVAKTEEYKVKRQLRRMVDGTISEIVKKCKGKCSECEVVEECRKARGEYEINICR